MEILISSKAIASAVERQEARARTSAQDLSSWAIMTGVGEPQQPSIEVLLDSKRVRAELDSKKLDALRKQLANPSILTRAVDLIIG
jgi:hypothetical protein